MLPIGDVHGEGARCQSRRLLWRLRRTEAGASHMACLSSADYIDRRDESEDSEKEEASDGGVVGHVHP